MIKVRALPEMSNVIDSEIGRKRRIGEEWEVTEERAKVLLGNNSQNKVYVEEIKEEKIEEPKKKRTKATNK